MTLANGQVIADAKIVEKDGKLQLEQQVKGVIYTEPSDKNNPKNGQIKAEIDNELIQGSKVEIEYEIKVQNNSEIDYDSERYYCYGEKVGEIVKIKAAAIAAERFLIDIIYRYPPRSGLKNLQNQRGKLILSLYY